jgi:hypothetical protein
MEEATPQSPMCPATIPGEVLVGILKLGETIHWTILRFADSQLKHAIWGGDSSADRVCGLLPVIQKTSPLKKMLEFKRYSSESKKLCSFTCDIFLDKRNPIGYNAAHDKIFYP